MQACQEQQHRSWGQSLACKSPEPNGVPEALSYSGYKSERAAPGAPPGVPSKHQPPGPPELEGLQADA